MNVRTSGVLGGLLGVLIASVAAAAPVPVKVNLSNLRCIQNYQVSVKDDDPVYLTVNGVAKGADVAKRIPETGTTPANSKKPAITEDKPMTLWEGELADGEFALLTVTLFQGKGDDAAKT